jgi:hypothetical protein
MAQELLPGSIEHAPMLPAGRRLRSILRASAVVLWPPCIRQRPFPRIAGAPARVARLAARLAPGEGAGEVAGDCRSACRRDWRHRTCLPFCEYSLAPSPFAQTPTFPACEQPEVGARTLIEPDRCRANGASPRWQRLAWRHRDAYEVKAARARIGRAVSRQVASHRCGIAIHPQLLASRAVGPKSRVGADSRQRPPLARGAREAPRSRRLTWWPTCERGRPLSC